MWGPATETALHATHFFSILEQSTPLTPVSSFHLYKPFTLVLDIENSGESESLDLINIGLSFLDEAWEPKHLNLSFLEVPPWWQ